ncbi:hypothetical protein JCM19233_6667 [Vibrio astriarenae]|nr:hypothetical protein JCM19233_6667 [Vibrio sp. C7]
MFGLENFTPTDELTRYTDYKAMTEDNLDKSLGNMNRFNTLVNDMLYSAPARNIASRDSGNSSTFYSFSFKPSFNVWTHDSYYDDEGKLKLDITGLIKTISCLSGACNGSELPFVFNKPYKLDGQEVHPLSKDKALMNDMSRLWFSDELFNHQYISEVDNTIVISEDGEIDFEVVDWDRTFNESEDVDLAPGRLTVSTTTALRCTT